MGEAEGGIAEAAVFEGGGKVRTHKNEAGLACCYRFQLYERRKGILGRIEGEYVL